MSLNSEKAGFLTQCHCLKLRLHTAPGQLPSVQHLIIMSGCDQPHQGAQAPSHETNTSQLVGVPLFKAAVRDF